MYLQQRRNMNDTSYAVGSMTRVLALRRSCQLSAASKCIVDTTRVLDARLA